MFLLLVDDQSFLKPDGFELTVDVKILKLQEDVKGPNPLSLALRVIAINNFLGYLSLRMGH